MNGTESGATIEYSTNGTDWSDTFTPTEGENTVHVRQTDLAGNTSASSELAFTVDTQAAAPTIALQNDTGNTNDLVSSDGQLQVGNLESGARVEYSIDGEQWSNSFTPLEGSNTVYVRQIDLVGNVSDSSDSLTFTLDTSSQTPVVSLVHDSGISSSDFLTNNAHLQLSGLEDGATVEYSLDGSQWSTEEPLFIAMALT